MDSASSPNADGMINAFVTMFCANEKAPDSTSTNSGHEPKRKLQYAGQESPPVSGRTGGAGTRHKQYHKRESETFFDAISLIPPNLYSTLSPKEPEFSRLLHQNTPLDAYFSDSKTFSLLLSNCFVAKVQLGADGVEVCDWKVESGLATAMQHALGSSATSSPASSAPPSPARPAGPRVGFVAEQAPTKSPSTPQPPVRLERSTAGIMAKGYVAVCLHSARLFLFRHRKKGQRLDYGAPGDIVCSKKIKLNAPALQISVNLDSDLMIVLMGTEVAFLHFESDFSLHSLGSTALPMSSVLQASWVPQKPRTLRVFGQNSADAQFHIVSQTLLMPDPDPGVNLIFGPLATLEVSAAVTAVATATHDPDLCAIATEDGRVMLVDLREGVALRSSTLPSSALALRFHPVGGIIVASTIDGGLTFLDLALHPLALQRELAQRQPALDCSSVCGRPLSGAALVLWFPPCPTLSDLSVGLDAWIEGGAEALVDSLLVVWERGPAAVLALDLGPVAGGRWGAQEVCACWLARGDWARAEDLIWSSNGRQRQACASLIVHRMLRECYAPGQLHPASASPAAFFPLAVGGPDGAGARPTREQFQLLLSRVAQLAQDSGEGVLNSLVADVTRRLFFWSLMQGDLQACEAIGAERGEADLQELLVVWAGRAVAESKPSVEIAGAAEQTAAEREHARLDWEARGRGEHGERVHMRAMEELERIAAHDAAEGRAVASPAATVGRGGVWEQERDRRSLRAALADPHLAGLVEGALRLDLQGPFSHELSETPDVGRERELELLVMLQESRGRSSTAPPPNFPFGEM